MKNIYTQIHSQQIKHSIKTAIAALLSAMVYAFFNLPNGYWVVITAVIVMQSSIETSSLESIMKIGMERFIGTLLGSAVAMIFLLLFSFAHWPIYHWELLLVSTIFVFVGSYLSYFYRSLNLMAVTAVIVLVGGSQQGVTWQLAAFRSLEILLGVLIALLVTVLLWPYRLNTFLKSHLFHTLRDMRELYSQLIFACLEKVEFSADFESRRHKLATKIKKDELLLNSLPVTRAKDSATIAKMLYLQLSFVRHMKALDDIVPHLGKELYCNGFPEAVREVVQAVAHILDTLAHNLKDSKVVPIDLEDLQHKLQYVDQLVSQHRQTRLKQILNPIPFQENHAFFSFFYELAAIARVTMDMVGLLSGPS